MNPDDVAFIDAQVTKFREQLLKTPYLARINKAQRAGLAQAFSTVLSLPALARERASAETQAEVNKSFRREAAEQAKSERT